MGSGKLDLGIIFLTQTAVGILGNSSLLCLYNISLITGHKLKPTDLILNQLVLANSLVLFFKGIPQTITAFGFKYFLDDAGCKCVFYFYRVGTGVSFSTICLLNGFQAIKLNPNICRWMDLRIKSPKIVAFCCSLCWILHLSINSFLPIILNGPLKNKNLSEENHYGYCSWSMSDRLSLLYTLVYFSSDFISFGFVIGASVSMVLVLLRHQQRVQHIHSKRRFPRPSHEVRAIYTILILVSSFVTFYSVYTILTFWMTIVVNPGQWMVNSSVLVASCFPALSPFVLMASDTRVSKFCYACRSRTNCFPNLITGL